MDNMNAVHFSMISLVEYQQRFEACGCMVEGWYDFGWALMYARSDLAQYLISKNEHNHVRYSSLSFIKTILDTVKSEHHRLELLKIILEAGINPNIDILKDCPGHRDVNHICDHACNDFFIIYHLHNLSSRILELLLNHGFDINIECRYHNMMSKLWCEFHGHNDRYYGDSFKPNIREMMRTLIEKGISLERTLSFFTPEKVNGCSNVQIRLLQSFFFEDNPRLRRLVNELRHGPSILNSRN